MNLFDLTGSIEVVGLDKMQTGINNLSNSINTVANGLTNIGSKLYDTVSKPIEKIVESGLKYNMTMEAMTSNFKVMLGSQELATDMIKKLTDMAVKTPFRTQELSAYTQQLLSMGYTGDNVIPIMSKLGDISLGNSEKMGRLTYAVGQIRANGRLLGSELRQLTELGFNPLEIITKKTGETMEEARERMSDGGIAYEEFEATLIDVTSAGGKFFGGMAEGSKTLVGMLSTLQDKAEITLGIFTKPIFDKIVEIMPRVIKSVDDLSNSFIKLDPKSQMIILGLTGLVALLPVLIIGLGGAVAGLGLFVGLVANLLTPLGLLTAGIGILISGSALGGLITLLTNIPSIDFSKWKDEFNSLKDKAVEIYGYFRDIWKPALKYLLTDNPVELAKIKDEDFRNSIEDLKNTIDKMTDNVKEKVNEISKAFKGIDKKDVAEFSTNLAEIAKSLIDIADVTGGAIKKLNEFFTALNNVHLFQPDKKKKLEIDVDIDDSKAREKIDFSNNSLKEKSLLPIPNVIKNWGTDAIINDSSAKSKTDFSNQQIQQKANNPIMNVIKNWGTDAKINDEPAKTKIKTSNDEIRSRANQAIPDQNKHFKMSASVDTSSAMSSIGSAFSSIVNHIASYSGSIFSNIKIPGFATGVRNFGGGLAIVGEKGPELVSLPKGSNVYTNNESQNMMTANGANEGFTFNGNIIIDSKNIEEFNNIVDFFKNVKQQSFLRGGI